MFKKPQAGKNAPPPQNKKNLKVIKKENIICFICILFYENSIFFKAQGSLLEPEDDEEEDDQDLNDEDEDVSIYIKKTLNA